MGNNVDVAPFFNEDAMGNNVDVAPFFNELLTVSPVLLFQQKHQQQQQQQHVRLFLSFYTSRRNSNNPCYLHTHLTHTIIGLRASKACVRLGAGIGKASHMMCDEIFVTVSEFSTHTLDSGLARPV
jgi:hypothetical protein